jgi:hypothetical protein
MQSLSRARLIQISVFWHVTPCSPLEMNRRFGGTFSLNVSATPSELLIPVAVIDSSCLYRHFTLAGVS